MSKLTRRDWQSRTLPTARLVRAGNPQLVEGLTQSAQSLKNFCTTAMNRHVETGEHHWRIMEDKTLTDAGRLVRSSKLLKARMSDAARDFESRLDQASVEMGQLRHKLDQHLKTSAEQATADAEMRSYLRQLPDNKRLSAIRSDPALMGAAARAPSPTIAGLAPEVHASLRDDFLASADPVAHAQFKDLDRAMKAAGETMKSIISDSDDLVDHSTAEAYEKSSTASLV